MYELNKLSGYCILVFWGYGYPTDYVVDSEEMYGFGDG